MKGSNRGIKRKAEVPYSVQQIDWCISRADLLEAAYSLAQQAAGDSEKGVSRLQEEVNVFRLLRKQKTIKVVEA